MTKPFEMWLNAAPLWLIAILVLGGMLASGAFGLRLRAYGDSSAKGGSEDGGTNTEGYIVSSVLGLLALLMGFTFALAVDRFDTRRERVLVEANAIGTTYLRAQMLEEPYRTKISDTLKRYVDIRLELADATTGDQKAKLLATNDALVNDLWTQTVAAYPGMKAYPFSTSFLETMNSVIDQDASRKMARKARVPTEVLVVLICYLLVSAGVMGYVLVGRRGKMTAALLFLLYGMSLMLIIDIDRPTSGRITESQDAMIMLRNSLRSQGAGAPASPAPPASAEAAAH